MTLTWWVDDEEPSIGDTLTIDGVAVDLSTASPIFKMRAVGSDQEKISEPVSSKNAQGEWTYDWQTGDLDTAGTFLAWMVVGKQTLWEMLVEVRAHGVPKVYAELEEVKNALSLSGLSFADLDIIAGISAASRAIDNECGRFFYGDAENTTSVSYYDAATKDLVLVDDVINITEIALDTTGAGTYSYVWPTQYWDAGPYNAPAIGWPYEWIRRRAYVSTQYLPCWIPRCIRVTGRHGWAAVPAPIHDATVMLTHRLLRRKREAPFAIVASGSEMGPGLMRISKSDPDVYSMIGPYIRSRPF